MAVFVVEFSYGLALPFIKLSVSKPQRDSKRSEDKKRASKRAIQKAAWRVAQFLGNMLMDYCDAADRGVKRQDFDRVDRKRWPHKREEERFVPTMYFGLERAERRGLQKGKQLGIEQGKQLGIEQGKQLGIEQGEQLGLQKGEQLGLQKGVEQKQMEAAQLMLSDGVPEAQVCKFLKLTKKELTAIKRKLKN